MIAICITIAIIYFIRAFSKGFDKWNISTKMILINELQLLIEKLPLNVDSFDRIIVEFSKLELTDTQEDGLWQIFMTRFERIAKHRETVNYYASSKLNTRLKNRRKAIESELNDIIKDREKNKSLFDRQQTNAKEQVLILLLNEYNDLLSEEEKKKQPEKTEGEHPEIKSQKVKRVKKIEIPTLAL